MDAVRKHTVVEEDGTVTVSGLPYKKGDQVEIIVLKGGEAAKAATARDLAHSPIAGMWADRTDITDSSEYARILREKAEGRGDRA